MTEKVTVQVVGLHPLIHPVTAQRFEHGQPTEVEHCGWAKSQLAAGSMKKVEVLIEAPGKSTKAALK